MEAWATLLSEGIEATLDLRKSRLVGSALELYQHRCLSFHRRSSPELLSSYCSDSGIVICVKVGLFTTLLFRAALT